MPENGTVLSEDESADTDVSLPDSSPPAEPAAVGQPELAGPWAPELVTLSMLPRSVWQSLVHLDAIKVQLSNTPNALLLYSSPDWLGYVWQPLVHLDAIKVRAPNARLFSRTLGHQGLHLEP